jgi:ferredoxin
MALAARRLPSNAPGDLFVDDRCIACDTCRRIAPGVYGGGEDDTAFVAR